MDSWRWIQRHLKIVNAKGVLVRLVPNIGQILLHNTMARQRDAGFPVRIVLLKPRQVGWSTWVEAEAFREINVRSNWTALCVSVDSDSTDLVFNMAKTFQDEMPDGVRRSMKRSNRKEICYSSPWRSRILTQTAGKTTMGRGGTAQFLHGSEVAFWPSAKENLGGVLNLVPLSVDSTVVLESTANGMGGEFYERFWRAYNKLQLTPDDLSGFIPVFFPWYLFPEYSSAVVNGFEMTYEEKQVAEEFKLSDGQIFWRRLKLDEMGGDEVLFKQEYPATAREAFQSSGRTVFPQGILDIWQKRAESYERVYGLFTDDGFRRMGHQQDVWVITTFPQPGHEYCLGADVMEGLVSDRSNERSKPDYHGAVVFDRTTMEAVAIYKGRCDPSEFGDQCVLAAKQYNMAWATPEINDAGFVVLQRFKKANYPNIYQRQLHDEYLVETDGDALGWRTTRLTRKWLVDTLRDAVRNKEIKVPFIEIIDEMRTFIVDKTGKCIHLPSEHDDLLFGLMIALQLHLRCPLRPRSYEYGHTWEWGDEDEAPVSLSRSGVYDPGLDFFEDEEDDSYTE